jgi:Holliday junction resolvasome RuvABC DNA-binding subunit
MSSIYSTTDILLKRIETLVALGYDREEAARMVAETFSVRPPGA